MSLFWVAQTIGALAVVLSVLVYTSNKRSTMLRVSCGASLLYALQFLFLQAYPGSLMNLIAAVRNYTFYKTKSAERSAWILALFISLGVAATFFTWKGPASLLPLGGNGFNALATWQMSTKWMRRFALGAPPLWIAYSLLVHSYPTLFIEIVIFFSNIFGQYRFDYTKAKLERSVVAKP